MELVKQREALTGEINGIFVSPKSRRGSECRGQDRRLGGHGTQLVYLHGGIAAWDEIRANGQWTKEF